ncbi:hypothetical protein, partial [Clostridium sp.]|uniref:TcaA 3rd/4th domain-containing protein n=1 Tax=Clostridium sp. TaxID=1506 RepID=UPI0034647235
MKEIFDKIKNSLYKLKDNLEVFFKDSKKRNTVIVIAFSLAIIVFGGVIYSIVNSSRDSVIKKFESTLNSSNPYKVYKYMKVEGSDRELNEENIKPLVDYLKENQSRTDELISVLRFKDSSKDLLKLKKEERVIGDRYYIGIEEVSLKVTVNLKGTRVMLNDKEVAITQKDNEVVNIDNIIPGTYNIKGIYDGNYGDIEDSITEALVNKENTKSLNLQGVNLTLDSNYKDAKVFINGEDTSKTVKEFSGIGPIPSDGSYKVHLEKEFPWGTVKSEEKEIQDLPKISLQINPLTEQLRVDLEKVYKEFYDNFFKALNEGDKSYIKNTTEDIRDRLYNEYYNSGIIIKNSYDFKNLEWQKDAISIKEEDGKFKT